MSNSKSYHLGHGIHADVNHGVRTSLADDNVPQSPAELVKAIAEAGKPGTEHAKLQPLAGSWTYTCKFWMDPSQPPMESKGTIERQWILGGRFLEEKVVGTHFDGNSGFEGFRLIGYDNGRRKSRPAGHAAWARAPAPAWGPAMDRAP